jgi:hypothetical protein
MRLHPVFGASLRNFPEGANKAAHWGAFELNSRNGLKYAAFVCEPTRSWGTYPWP